jgi:hypothetical protein
MRAMSMPAVGEQVGDAARIIRSTPSRGEEVKRGAGAGAVTAVRRPGMDEVGRPPVLRGQRTRSASTPGAVHGRR